MAQSKWLKLGAASFMSIAVLTACGEEEPAEDEEVIEAEDAIDEEEVIDEEEAIEEEVVEEEPLEEMDFGSIDQEELEMTYLEPLGWTATEFEEYTIEEYDMALTDFADFTELEETVGSVADILVTEGDTAAGEVDYGAIDPIELGTYYLTPLGWTPVEFNEYVLAEYDKGIADFADFTELEGTVGSVEDIEAAE